MCKIHLSLLPLNSLKIKWKIRLAVEDNSWLNALGSRRSRASCRLCCSQNPLWSIVERGNDQGTLCLQFTQLITLQGRNFRALCQHWNKKKIGLLVSLRIRLISLREIFCLLRRNSIKTFHLVFWAHFRFLMVGVVRQNKITLKKIHNITNDNFIK